MQCLPVVKCSEVKDFDLFLIWPENFELVSHSHPNLRWELTWHNLTSASGPKTIAAEYITYGIYWNQYFHLMPLEHLKPFRQAWPRHRTTFWKVNSKPSTPGWCSKQWRQVGPTPSKGYCQLCDLSSFSLGIHNSSNHVKLNVLLISSIIS